MKTAQEYGEIVAAQLPRRVGVRVDAREDAEQEDDPFANGDLVPSDTQDLAVDEQQAIAVIAQRRSLIPGLVANGDVGGLKNERDWHTTVKRLTKIRGFSLAAQWEAAIGTIEATRGLGSVLKPIVRAGRPGPNSVTLTELGIDENLSRCSQQLADMPDEKVEKYFMERKEAGKEVTVSGALGYAKSLAIQAVRDSYEKLKKADGKTPGIVTPVEAVTFLEALSPQSADLLITDPPYSTDVEDIETFASTWLPLALSRVAPTGRAYVCIGAYPDELAAYLMTDRAGMELAQILVWTYRNTLGPSPADEYKLNWQAILYFKGSQAPELACPEMKEQFSVQDINAPDGRQGDRFHAWQKPDALAERFIRHSTVEGARVIDPFAGTGTFLAAASRLKRLAIGSEVSPSMLDLCRKRGLEVGK